MWIDTNFSRNWNMPAAVAVGRILLLLCCCVLVASCTTTYHARSSSGAKRKKRAKIRRKIAKPAPRVTRAKPKAPPKVMKHVKAVPVTGEQGIVIRYGAGAQGPQRMNVTLVMPKGSGPFSTVVLNHGSPRSAKSRRTKARYPTATAWFLKRGFAVVVPNRRGYGGSDGGYSEGFGRCETPNYVRAGNETARDIGVVLSWLEKQRWVRRGHVIVAGGSAGGWGSLAAAGRSHSDVAGVINYAGGRGSPRDGFNCGPQQLVVAARVFGRKARVPSLWVYSVNDPYFPPNLARQMHGAYKRETRTATQFLMLPKVLSNGHALLSSRRGPEVWGAHVDEFLRRVLRHKPQIKRNY